MADFLPNPVNALMRDTVTGSISRRDLIRRGSQLGLSSALMGTLLRAQSVGAQATPSASADLDRPVGWSIKAPAGLRTDLKGKKISVVLGATGPGESYDQATCDAFTAATGIEVNYIRGADSSTDRLQFYLQSFGAEATDVDACQIDVIWPGTLAQYAVDLTDVYRAQDVASFPRIVANNTVDGKLVGIPWYTDAGLLYYRTDLLEKYGFSKPPQTWQELTDQATAIYNGETGANSAFVGFTWQGAAYEGLVCNGLEWQYSFGGGTIVDEHRTATVNNDQSVEAISLARSWVKGISTRAVTGYEEEDSRIVWQQGNAAFMRNWPYAYSLSASSDSILAGKFAVTQLPQGNGTEAAHAATLGGWQMMVSKYSKEQDAAKEWTKFITSPELQRSRAIERSNLPTIGSLYEDPDIAAAYPFFKGLFPVFESGSVARPSTVCGDLYPQVAVAYQTRINEILSGKDNDVAGALGDLANQIDDILKQA